jgi:glutamyl-tRNA synthetase
MMEFTVFPVTARYDRFTGDRGAILGGGRRIGTLAVMTSREFRVRFAPSPTGLFHVGGARSALFNAIVARQAGGAFVLRIEDTDVSRNRPEWTDGIISALDWIGISPGTYEGPVFSSANGPLHTEAAEKLYAAGRAYYCDCTREEVVARTGNPAAGYDGHCRARGLGPGEGRALRFRTPDEGVTVVTDLVRGTPEFANATIEDFVIVRGNGTAVFLLANVVDDIDERITHVIRAEEHLSNAPKQQLLFEALGAPTPIWAHIPVIVNEKRRKLSKRRDKVALEDYRAEGYLADAMKNYLMLLGWAPSGDREILPWDEIEAEFRLDDVKQAPAFFDEKKLRAFNGEYIRALEPGEFVEACRPWVSAGPVPWRPGAFDDTVFATLAREAQSRVFILSEIVPMVEFAFVDVPEIDEAAWAKATKGAGRDVLRSAIAAFAEEDLPWDEDSLKGALEQAGLEHGLKLSKSQAPVRVAVTGRSVGLPLFLSLEVLGRSRTLARLRAALDRPVALPA